MTRVVARTPPETSLMARLAARPGVYSDAFCVDLPEAVGLPAFIAAFYGTRLFSAERAILRLAGMPGTRADLAALAAGDAATFAAWTVEERREDEILLADFADATKSWLHVAPHDRGTILWFGSAILPPDAAARIGPAARLSIGPHRFYSRRLLSAAARDLRRPTRRP